MSGSYHNLYYCFALFAFIIFDLATGSCKCAYSGWCRACLLAAHYLPDLPAKVRSWAGELGGRGY